jgi:hypothetical protein
MRASIHGSFPFSRLDAVAPAAEEWNKTSKPKVKRTFAPHQPTPPNAAPTPPSPSGRSPFPPYVRRRATLATAQPPRSPRPTHPCCPPPHDTLPPRDPAQPIADTFYLPVFVSADGP